MKKDYPVSDDSMRLSDLAPMYARFYKVSPQEAAYALYELIERLYIEYGVNRFSPCSVNNIFWVGSVGNYKRSARTHVIYFQELSRYFYNIFCSPPRNDNSNLDCYCEDVRQSISVPASVVYFSRSALSEWILNAGFESPDFIVSDKSTEKRNKAGGDEFSQQELGSIIKVMKGLLEVVKAVDKAHREPPSDYDGVRRANKIKSYAYMFNNPPRENFDVCSHLILLAEEAGIDMLSCHKTFRKYMGIGPRSNKKV